MIAKAFSERMSRLLRFGLLSGSVLVASGVGLTASADQANGVQTLVVSRIQYVAPTPAPEPFPQIFNDPNVSGVQGNIFLDYYKTYPGPPPLGTLPLTAAAVKQGQPIITTSFSSKSEGSLHLSVDGHFLTYMGYNAAAGLEGVSNSETTNPNAQITGATGPFYDRAVALIRYDGTVTVTNQDFAYSGDNPRGAITLDGKEFYMAGNADSTTNQGGTTGPGLTHIKDNNWRGIGVFSGANGNQNLHVSKGSGGNGDDGIFQVLNGNFPNATPSAPASDGLQINKPKNILGCPVPTFTTGLRNLTGRVNGDGTVTIYAVTAQTSTISGGEPDPTKLVAVTDVIAATQLPVDNDYGQWSDYQGTLEQFVTLQQSRSGEVFRGVAFAPSP